MRFGVIKNFLKFVGSEHISTSQVTDIVCITNAPYCINFSALLIANKKETLQTEDSGKENDLK